MDQAERDFIRRSAARVEEWENTPRPFDDPYSDMNTEEKSKLLVYLQQTIDNLNNTVESLREELRQSREQKEELLRSQADLRSALNVLSQSLLSAESAQKQAEVAQKQAESVIKQQARQISDLRDQLKRNNKAQFGSKSQKKKAGNDEPPTHGESKDQFDGTSGSVDEKNESGKDMQPSDKQIKPRTDRQKMADILRKGSTYRTMDADTTVTHRSDKTRLPAGAQILKTITRYGYEHKVSVIEHEYELVVYKLGDTITTAYLPVDGEPEVIDIVPGTHASADMLATLAYHRFTLDVPLYREIGYLWDEGFRLSRKTLTNWLHKGSLLLTPVIEELKRIALEKDSIINCDETWCRVKVFDSYRKRYIWCLVNKEARIVIYCYEDGSRGRDALREILGDSELKSLQTDGYNVYMYLDNELIDIDHICCMAHARAKFKYASDAGDRDADYVLGCIGELYALEDIYRKTGLDAEAVRRARNSTRTLEIIGRLRSKMDVLLSGNHPVRGELMEKAVRYLDTYWKQIFRYTQDGRYSIDNNIAERYIRPLAGERKNSLFFGSHKMARASAVFHTVISTCRICGLSALDYLRTFFRKIVSGTTDYSSLLPQTIGLSTNKC